MSFYDPMNGLDVTSNSTASSTQKLISTIYNKKSSGDDEALVKLAQKNRSDTVKLSYFMLKQRLSDSLDQVLQKEFQKNPELKNNIHIGIVTDDNLRVEVIPKEKAIKAAVDVSEEDARKVLEQNPVGYYQSENFSVSTPDEPNYQSMKKQLNHFFEKNAPLISYLREHPEQDINVQEILQR